MKDEFKAFIQRGNVVDLAVGVILGGAFGTIVNSFVKDMLMPVVGLFLGGVSFSDLFISLTGQVYPSLKAAQDAGAPTLNYGLFLQAMMDFLIIAMAIFLLVKAMSSRKPVDVPSAATTRACPHCLSTIALKATRCPNCTSQISSDEAMR
jgi:large conductance mechanosensitive channel